MLIKLKRVSKGVNEDLTLPSGIILHDEAEDCLYLHDGESPGGYRFNLQLPQHAFLGEVPVSDLINGIDLAALIGVTEGVAQNSNDPWLKFIYQGKILYVARRPYRHSISWDHLDSRGAVFGTDASEIEIDGIAYRVRLLTGGVSASDTIEESEWNQLMYPVHVDDPEQRRWARYDDNFLGIGDTRNGSNTWCQEAPPGQPTTRVVRGSSELTTHAVNFSQTTIPRNGWRPVLEPYDPATAIYPLRDFYTSTDYVQPNHVYDWIYTD